MESRFDIHFPTASGTTSIIKPILTNLDTLIADCILYLAYGIAILSGFKFIIYIVNGFTSNTGVGSASMDDSSFERRKNWSE